MKISKALIAAVLASMAISSNLAAADSLPTSCPAAADVLQAIKAGQTTLGIWTIGGGSPSLETLNFTQAWSLQDGSDYLFPTCSYSSPVSLVYIGGTMDKIALIGQNWQPGAVASCTQVDGCNWGNM